MATFKKLSDVNTIEAVGDNTNILVENDGEIEKIAASQMVPSGVIMSPATAAVGQTIVVKAVDENGKPTEWKAADIAMEETDPTVPDWAKAETKPTYTAEEIGADASGTAATIISEHNVATDSHSDIRSAISSITPESIDAAPILHSQSASTITAGTFAGEVIANASGQTESTSLLRNSKLVSTDTNPTVNGEICWTYA